MFPYPVAVQVGTPHLGRLANTLLMLLNVVQDGDQPANSGPSTSLTTVSDEDVHPFTHPFFHCAHNDLPQIRICNVDPPVPQLGGHLLAGLQIQRPRCRDLDPEPVGQEPMMFGPVGDPGRDGRRCAN